MWLYVNVSIAYLIMHVRMYRMHMVKDGYDLKL